MKNTEMISVRAIKGFPILPSHLHTNEHFT